jgi:hypothetical protein
MHLTVYDEETEAIIYINPSWSDVDGKSTPLVEINSQNSLFPSFYMPLDLAYRFGEAIMQQVDSMDEHVGNNIKYGGWDE